MEPLLSAGALRGPSAMALDEASRRRIAEHMMLGSATALREARELLLKISASPATTLLITGESGVGKDIAAHLVHATSARAAKPFVNITCSALQDSLLESELFGHERGAFTDARQRKQGLLERAHGGTAFLDEVGEMSQPLQAKLLRFLEERAFRRVGGSEDVHTDVRVIAATHRDLRSAVEAGTFREDLYYRLAVLHVNMPPLRERRADLEPLIMHFIERFSHAFDKQVRGIRADASALLLSHDWPGNVRELKNAVERAVLLSDSEQLSARDFALERSHGYAGHKHLLTLPSAGLSLEELEQDLLTQALERTHGNKTRAAILLGLTRDQVRHRAEKYAIRCATSEAEDCE